MLRCYDWDPRAALSWQSWRIEYRVPIIASGNSIFVIIGHLFVRRNRITQIPAVRTVDEHNELEQAYIDVCSFLSAIFAKSIILCQQTVVVMSVCLSVCLSIHLLSVYTLKLDYTALNRDELNRIKNTALFVDFKSNFRAPSACLLSLWLC